MPNRPSPFGRGTRYSDPRKSAGGDRSVPFRSWPLPFVTKFNFVYVASTRAGEAQPAIARTLGGRGQRRCARSTQPGAVAPWKSWMMEKVAAWACAGPGDTPVFYPAPAGILPLALLPRRRRQLGELLKGQAAPPAQVADLWPIWAGRASEAAGCVDRHTALRLRSVYTTVLRSAPPVSPRLEAKLILRR